LKFRRLLINIFLWLTLIGNGAQAGSERSLPETINFDLSNGKIVVVYQMLNDDTASEQYADWAYYLNEFAESNTPQYQFYAADAALNDRLAENNLAITDSYTLFLKKHEASFYYQGVLVESPTYLAIKTYYAGEELTPMHHAFMPEEVTINLD